MHRPRTQHRASSLTRWLIAGGIAVGLTVVGLSAVSPAPAPARRHEPQRALPPGFDLLASTIAELQRTLLPEEKQRLLQALRDNPPQLTAALLWVLRQPRHELFPGAAQLAGDLGIAEAIEPLAAALAGSVGRARAPSLLALDALQPFDDDTLQTIATECEGNPDLALAVLQLVRARPSASERLLVAALGLLSHRDEHVRRAALQLLPDELPGACAEVLLTLVDDPLAGETAVSLLARVPPTAATIAILAERLGDSSGENQSALLLAIDRYATAAPVRELLWQLATNDGPTPPRAAALYGLERVRDTRPLPADVGDWPALLRYHAARLRIATGSRDGIDMLVAMLTSEDEDSVTNSGRARITLSQLSRLPPHSPVETFVAWRAALTAMPTHEMSPPRSIR